MSAYRDVETPEAAPEADRTTGAPHPRETATVFGHDDAEAEFLAAFNSGRMSHAWLLTGPRGIGKASFAWRAARFLLATEEASAGPALFDSPPRGSLDISPEHPVARRVLQLSEPGLALLRRPWDAEKGRHKTEITVDEVRRLRDFFAMSAGGGGRRVVIVDSVDEMNVNAANALLKVLEEPPARSLLLLVSHQPARLLPTIRSRCRVLKFHPLGAAQMEAALMQAGVEPDDVPALAELSQGSVGDALRLSQNGGVALYSDLVALFAAMPGAGRTAMIRLAEATGGRTGGDAFDLTLTLTDRILSRLARHGATGQPPGAEIAQGEAAMLARLAPTQAAARGWAELAQTLSSQARRGKAVNLDPPTLILDMLLEIDRAAVRLSG